MSKYAEGYVAGVTQVTSSTINIEDLFKYGKKKAYSHHKHINRGGYIPSKLVLDEFDKGWYDSIVQIFEQFKIGEVILDTMHEDFINLATINKLIEKSYRETVKLLESEYYKDKVYPNPYFDKHPSPHDPNNHYAKKSMPVAPKPYSQQLNQENYAKRFQPVNKIDNNANKSKKIKNIFDTTTAEGN